MLIFNQVERVKQESEWDCGLACAEMVLRTITSLEFPKINLRTLVHGENIWTIDLAYLFHSFDINFTFYTTSTEVLPEYSNIEYYNQNVVFQNELERVNSLFQNAPNKNISIQKRSVELNEIIEWIEARNLIIALIDDAIRVDNNHYCGHFVVICGVDQSKNVIYYTDPGKNAPLDGIREVTFEVFEKMRKSFGTDEDLLFISSPPNHFSKFL